MSDFHSILQHFSLKIGIQNIINILFYSQMIQSFFILLCARCYSLSFLSIKQLATPAFAYLVDYLNIN